MTRLHLFRSLRRPVSLLALLALLFAQTAMGFHAASHLRGSDSTSLPGGSHVQICLECASFAPLASAHGGIATSLTVAALGVEEFVRLPERASVVRSNRSPFRARAPPR